MIVIGLTEIDYTKCVMNSAFIYLHLYIIRTSAWHRIMEMESRKLTDLKLNLNLAICTVLMLIAIVSTVNLYIVENKIYELAMNDNTLMNINEISSSDFENRISELESIVKHQQMLIESNNLKAH